MTGKPFSRVLLDFLRANKKFSSLHQMTYRRGQAKNTPKAIALRAKLELLEHNSLVAEKDLNDFLARLAQGAP